MYPTISNNKLSYLGVIIIIYYYYYYSTNIID